MFLYSNPYLHLTPFLPPSPPPITMSFPSSYRRLIYPPVLRPYPSPHPQEPHSVNFGGFSIDSVVGAEMCHLDPPSRKDLSQLPEMLLADSHPLSPPLESAHPSQDSSHPVTDGGSCTGARPFRPNCDVPFLLQSACGFN